MFTYTSNVISWSVGESIAVIAIELVDSAVVWSCIIGTWYPVFFVHTLLYFSPYVKLENLVYVIEDEISITNWVPAVIDITSVIK